MLDTWFEGAALEAAVDDTAGAPPDGASPSVADVVGAGPGVGAFSVDGEPAAAVDKYRLGPNNFVPFPGPDSIPSSVFAAGGAVAVAAVELTTVDGTEEAAVDGAASVEAAVDGAVVVDGAVDGAAAVDGAEAAGAGAAAGVMLCLATTELYCCISITAASSNTCTITRHSGGP